MPASELAILVTRKISIAIHRLAIEKIGEREAAHIFNCPPGTLDQIAQIVDLHYPPSDSSGLGFAATQPSVPAPAPQTAPVKPPQPSPMPMQAGSPLLPRIKELLAGSKKGFRVSNLATALKAPEADIELAISQPGSGLEIGQAGWVKVVK